ncbi:hypothetical protein MLD38_037965 [Melastoma candidum]|uniref:Uncharacterized protein n=1 Tax=Melastoma candidum TaxID=119954 RepID=A0ACB9KY52_9MYRT|nr:hypothetical protein MLD38_037965 [Melastoma candidum]
MRRPVPMAISVVRPFFVLSVMLGLLLMPCDGRLPTGGSPGKTLQVFQKKIPNLAKMLDKVGKRIRRHQSNNAGPPVSNPTMSGASSEAAIFLVTVGLGTPPVTLQLELSTGSDWTWTQCTPCATSCYSQTDPYFNPSYSTSYANVSCSSSTCTLFSGPSNPVPCSGQTCDYSIIYGDGSNSTGWVATDTLTLGSDLMIPNYLFGCGQNNGLYAGSFDGFLGLANTSVSLVSQTTSQFGKYFAYCLPYSSDSTGFLTFGGSNSTGFIFTPLVLLPQYPYLYGIQIIGISVGGIPLPASSLNLLVNAHAIIDSGTVITRLPPTVYDALRTAVRASLANYTTAPAVSILDTCYDFSKVQTIPDPNIGISFQGVGLTLGTTGAFYVVSSSQRCLAFAANGDDSDLIIYGNIQQRTWEIAYDVAGGSLGFSPNACA